MSVSIIDRSLVGFIPHENANFNAMLPYMNSILESGADYIEIDNKTLVHSSQTAELLKQKESCFIYRFSERGNIETEIDLVNSYKFSYVVLSLKNSYLINRFRCPVLLEADVNGVNVYAFLKVIAENINMPAVSLLRVKGLFDCTPEEFYTFIKYYRSHYTTPIDICPLNATLTALSTAITAYAANVDSITLSFGDDGNFGSLEEFIVALSTTYKLKLRSNYVVGICKSIFFSSMFSTNIRIKTLDVIMKHYCNSPRYIPVADEIPEEEDMQYENYLEDFFKQPSYSRKSAVQNQIEHNAAEVIVDDLTEIVEKQNMFSFNDFTKRSEFLS